MFMEPLLIDVSMEMNGLYAVLYEVSGVWKMLERLQSTLADRTTTRKEDEALCIASLVGQDPADFIGLSHQEGMIKLLHGMDGVPLALLFTITPRIDVDGCRWMPQTILWQGGNWALAGLNVACKQNAKGMLVSLRASNSISSR
jgi:hypothetical protein